jgi:biotin carboxyl carrier protein
MKMELSIKAERDGVVKQVYTASGTVVAAKDLLLDFS